MFHIFVQSFSCFRWEGKSNPWIGSSPKMLLHLGQRQRFMLSSEDFGRPLWTSWLCQANLLIGRPGRGCLLERAFNITTRTPSHSRRGWGPCFPSLDFKSLVFILGFNLLFYDSLVVRALVSCTLRACLKVLATEHNYSYTPDWILALLYQGRWSTLPKCATLGGCTWHTEQWGKRRTPTWPTRPNESTLETSGVTDATARWPSHPGSSTLQQPLSAHLESQVFYLVPT